jgi:hypothetical protein
MESVSLIIVAVKITRAIFVSAYFYGAAVIEVLSRFFFFFSICPIRKGTNRRRRAAGLGFFTGLKGLLPDEGGVALRARFKAVPVLLLSYVYIYIYIFFSPSRSSFALLCASYLISCFSCFRSRKKMQE